MHICDISTILIYLAALMHLNVWCFIFYGHATIFYETGYSILQRKSTFVPAEMKLCCMWMCICEARHGGR